MCKNGVPCECGLSGLFSVISLRSCAAASVENEEDADGEYECGIRVCYGEFALCGV